MAAARAITSRRIMTLKDFLVKEKIAILDGWLDRALIVYPVDSRDFFRKTRDPFSNPIGSALREGIESLYPELLQPMDPDRLGLILDPIMRIRAVEDLSPSRAISFIPSVKEVIKEALGDQILANVFWQEWLTLDGNIDQLTLQAFDIYMGYREKIHQLKNKELKGRAGKMAGERGQEKSPGEGR